jgi:hypothetical protein
MYEAHMGIKALPSSTWQFLKAFQIYRLTAIGHGVFARGLQGNASSNKALARPWREDSARDALIMLGVTSSKL